jgi:hypothetical protein
MFSRSWRDSILGRGWDEGENTRWWIEVGVRRGMEEVEEEGAESWAPRREMDPNTGRRLYDP